MSYPGARSTPTVDGELLYALGSGGDLACLETATGKVRWQKNIRTDFSGQPGKWAYSESPLIDGDVLVCTPGGSDATIVALNKKTGDVIWKSSVPGGDPAAFASAIIVSDYLKGCVTTRVMDAALDVARQRGIPLLVDPKIPHIDYYAGATLITPNHHEAEIATHTRIRSATDARLGASAFRDLAKCEAVLMTRGDQGMWLLASDAEGQLAAAAREVADVTGAGDTVIATLALAIGSGATTLEAAHLANEAAGIAVGKFGAATVTPTELLRALQAHAER